MNIREKVYNFKTENKEGFTYDEINLLLKDFSDVNINMKRFDDALMGITCMMIDDKFIIYHCDVEKALLCGIEDRGLNSLEWD